MNGRIEWQVIDGRLKETSPDTPTFALTATDTLVLTGLLILELDTIKAAAEREQSGYSQTKDAARVREKYYEKKRQNELAEGVEGVEAEDVEITEADIQFELELPDTV